MVSSADVYCLILHEYKTSNLVEKYVTDIGDGISIAKWEVFENFIKIVNIN